MKVALVLGGGSARGLAHLGVIKTLRQEKIPIDLVVGTSIGSLMGAVYCLDSDLELIEREAPRVRWADLLSLNIPRMGLSGGHRLDRMIRRVVDGKEFKDLSTPLAIVAVDVETGEEVICQTGNLARAIRASCSIPGIFVPVEIDGRMLIDGGMKDTVPVQIARRLGADVTIAVDVGYHIRRGKINNIFQVIFQAYQIKGQELSFYQTLDADILIKPDLAGVDQYSFEEAHRMIELGCQATTRVMPQIKARLAACGR